MVVHGISNPQPAFCRGCGPLPLSSQFLAFKSDVDFWRNNKSLRGLSVRALFMEVVFQTVILLSLVEEEASLLVTVPAGVGVLIQVNVFPLALFFNIEPRLLATVGVEDTVPMVSFYWSWWQRVVLIV